MYVDSYYAVLHVPEDADAAVIRHAYRTLVRRYHPDAGIGSSAQKFRDVTEAYGVLSDPQRRRDHDIDLARSRAHSRVRPEPLIPETPTHIRFRTSAAPFHHSAFGFEREIESIFHMFDNIFERMW
jgi:curved DNA-binding protein CbpA